MLDSASPCSPQSPHGGDIPRAVRGDSELRATFAAEAGETFRSRTFERGALRLRITGDTTRCEGIIVNTGGGITGGDRLAIDLALDTGASALVTTQAAEKVYRSDGPAADIFVTLRLADAARLDWLPQETILFDRARVRRRLDIDIAPTATLTLIECLVFGRIAHGETMTGFDWHDRWRVRCAGRLALVEAVRLAATDATMLARPALAADARAIATILHVAPDAEARLAGLRAAVAEPHGLFAASAWNGMILARFAASDPSAVRHDVAMAAIHLTGAPLPRAWGC